MILSGTHCNSQQMLCTHMDLLEKEDHHMPYLLYPNLIELSILGSKMVSPKYSSSIIMHQRYLAWCYKNMIQECASKCPHVLI